MKKSNDDKTAMRFFTKLLWSGTLVIIEEV